jgi:hypothetical protein
MKKCVVWAQHTSQASRVDVRWLPGQLIDDDHILLYLQTAEVWASVEVNDSNSLFTRKAGRNALEYLRE